MDHGKDERTGTSHKVDSALYMLKNYLMDQLQW